MMYTYTVSFTSIGNVSLIESSIQTRSILTVCSRALSEKGDKKSLHEKRNLNLFLFNSRNKLRKFCNTYSKIGHVQNLLMSHTVITNTTTQRSKTWEIGRNCRQYIRKKWKSFIICIHMYIYYARFKAYLEQQEIFWILILIYANASLSYSNRYSRKNFK